MDLSKSGSFFYENFLHETYNEALTLSELRACFVPYLDGGQAKSNTFSKIALRPIKIMRNLYMCAYLDDLVKSKSTN